MESDESGQYESKQPQSQTIGLYGLNFLLWFFPKAGSRIQPHQHRFEHGSVLLRGTFRIEGDIEGRSGVDIVAPDVVRFAANVEHSILAKTDGALCLHIYPLKQILLNFWRRFRNADELMQDFHGGA